MFHGTLLDTEERDWDRSFDINVKSMFYTSQACIKMVGREERWGERGSRGEREEREEEDGFVGSDILMVFLIVYFLTLRNSFNEH